MYIFILYVHTSVYKNIPIVSYWSEAAWISIILSELDVPDCLYPLLPSNNQCIKSLLSDTFTADSKLKR